MRVGPPDNASPKGPLTTARNDSRTGLTSDFFRVIRECYLPLMLSHLFPELSHMVRLRPLASVAVCHDRYSVGYSVARVVLADRQCPLIITASGPSMTQGRGRLPLGHSRVE